MSAVLVRRAVAQNAPPATAAAKPQIAGEVFKNVTTSTLKGLTTADFLGAMGVMAAALGYARATGHPLQVQWTLLHGINDGAQEIVFSEG